MDARHFEELVSRWTSGDRLSPAEERRLTDWLTQHPEARADLFQDETLDSLLRCLPRLDDTAEDFVQQCLRRAAGSQAERRPQAAAVAAPPIVAPPVAMVRPAPAASQARRGRRLWAGGSGRWAAVMAACSAALLLVAIGWQWLARGPHSAGPNSPAVATHDARPLPSAGDRNSRPQPVRSFATLTQAAGAVWDTPHAQGDRLAAGLLQLSAGTAQLQFDKGSVVGLTAPAVLELRSADEVFLQRGSVTAHVPPPAVGFLVATPLSRIMDLGTEFDVTVDDSGATQTEVRRGRVSFTPHRGQEELGTPIELTAGALDHAAVSVPDVEAAVLPVTTIASGSQGRFLGRLSANGKSVEFDSPAAFHEFQALALEQLREAPSQFGQRWPTLAESGSKAEEPTPAGKGEEAGGGKAEPTNAMGKLATIAPADTAPETSKAPPLKNPAGRRDVPPSKSGRSGAGAELAGPHAGLGTGPSRRSVVIHENGKTISITDSKESGITISINEWAGGKRKTTEMRAANASELAKKYPEAHRLYRQYFHPRSKMGKGR